MTVRPERTTGLGRGLSALIPQRTPGQPAPVEIPLDRGSDRIRRSRADGSMRRASPRSRQASANTGSSSRSSSPRRSTATCSSPANADCARQPTAGLDRIPAIVRQLDERDAARGRPHREPPARRPRPDRGRPRLPPADRRVRLHATTTSPSVSDVRARPSRTRSASSISRPASRQPIADGRITEGHGRALGGLPIDHQDRVLRLGRSTGALGPPDRRARPPAARATAGRRREDRSRTTDPDLERVEEDLRRALGTKVSLARSRRGGRIVIEYYSDEELGRLYERLTGGTA